MTAAATETQPDLLTQVATYYHQTLSSSIAAKDFLSTHAITRPETVSALLIGYADGSLLDRAPAGTPTHRGLVAHGLLTGSGRKRHELMLGAITLPLRDIDGNIVGIYGRVIDSGRDLVVGHGLVNAHAAAMIAEIIVTNGIFDALSFLEAEIPNVVPIIGLHGWTADHDALVDRHRIRRIVLALGGDDAGHALTTSLVDHLAAHGLDAAVAAIPAKSANDLLVRESAKKFAEVWHALMNRPTTVKERRADPPKIELHHDLDDSAYVVPFGARTYRVRGLSALGVDRMRVNLRVEDPETHRFHVDSFDLYAARSRRNFIESAVVTLGEAGAAGEAAMTREIGFLIDALEAERLSLRNNSKTAGKKPVMTSAEKEEAMAMLRDPHIVDRIVVDFASVGCVGEESSMLAAYLAALSRKLPEPLAVLFCARSGAGKSNMQERITDFVPPEDLVRYTRLTGQALFYQDPDALKHKLLALDEEGGASEAIYSLRILQSSGKLSVSATRTDPLTGKHHAQHYEVHGPTAIMLTTAHPEALDYETRNRFVMLTADESAEQTRRILERQRWNDTLDGLVAQTKREAVIRRHRNAQRLIEALHVVNPHAPALHFPAGRLILRREQKKFLTIIKTIALLHQHQRERKKVEIGGGTITYIEVMKSDIELAQQIAPAILRRNLDELAPPTRALFDCIGQLVAAKMEELKLGQSDVQISRHELQSATGLSYWHLRTYLRQLVDYEYLAVVRSKQGRRCLYELIAEADEDDLATELAR